MRISSTVYAIGIPGPPNRMVKVEARANPDNMPYLRSMTQLFHMVMSHVLRIQHDSATPKAHTPTIRVDVVRIEPPITTLILGESSPSLGLRQGSSSPVGKIQEGLKN